MKKQFGWLISVTLVGFLLPQLVFASAIFSIVPSITTTTLRSDSSAVVRYTVTNNTSTLRTGLSITPSFNSTVTPGSVSLPSATDTCTGNDVASGASCTFSLLVSGSGNSGNFTLSPRVCSNNGVVCSQPTQPNRTAVTFANAPSSGSNAYIALGQSPGGSLRPIRVSDNALGTPVGNFSFSNLPVGVAINPAGTLAYIAISNASEILVYDLSTAPISLSHTISSVNLPVGVVMSPDGSKVYVANFGLNTVSVINTTTNTVSKTISVGTFPQGIAVLPNGSKVYVANSGNGSGNTVSVINTATDAVSTITVGADPIGVAVSPDGTKVYVTNNGNGASTTLSVINTATDAVSSTITVGTAPFGVAVTPDGSKVYVANEDTDNVSVINAVTGAVDKTISVGSVPAGIAVSPDGAKVFVNNRFDNSVSVINTTTDTVTATLTSGLTDPNSFGSFIG